MPTLGLDSNHDWVEKRLQTSKQVQQIIDNKQRTTNN